jgi:DNA repair exonuclease SbcCD ATPase subunit
MMSDAQSLLADIKRQITAMKNELSLKDKRIAELETERDAAFALSRCECGAEEACRNLVEKDKRIEELTTENSKLIAKMKEGTGPIFAWLTTEMNKVKPLEKRIAELNAELDRATLWNESVAVCARHVPDATQEGCVWCDLERAEAVLREVRELAELNHSWSSVKIHALRAILDKYDQESQE